MKKLVYIKSVELNIIHDLICDISLKRSIYIHLDPMN